jgi:UDP-N-acetylglucosamine 2-epimerase (non-hydrolysing)
VAEQKIHFVGNVMIDTLVRLLPKALEKWDDLSKILQVQKKNFCLVTLHRPSNVDKLFFYRTYASFRKIK